MDLAHPIRSVIPSLHGAVLEVLARTHRPMSGRQVARLVEPAASQKGVLNALSDLVHAGVVQREEVPPAALFQLNREHLAAPAVLVLSSLRSALFERIGESLAGWVKPPAASALFGSAARGDGDEHSDIDLLLLRHRDVAAEDPVWQEQKFGLVRAMEAWTGNSVQLLELSVEEISREVARGAPLIVRLREDAVDLMEPSVQRFLTPVGAS